MNNYIGFEEDRWYKIENQGDSTVMTVEGNKIMMLHTDDEREDHQRFKALAQDDGDFRLSSRFQASSNYVAVWDYLPHRASLIQKKRSVAEVSTQTWKAEKVTGMQCTFFIVSVPDPSKCLLNKNGQEHKTGTQVKVVKKAEVLHDKYAHWRLEPEPLA